MLNASIIRKLEPNDRVDVVRLWHDAWHDGFDTVAPADIVAERTIETFANRLPALEADSLVAERDGRTVAFAALVDNEIDQFFVAAEARGSGVSDALLRAAEAALARRGIRDAAIQCSAGNLRAHRFYSRNGWIDSQTVDKPMWTPDGRRATHPTHIFVKRLVPEGRENDSWQGSRACPGPSEHLKITQAVQRTDAPASPRVGFTSQDRP